MKKKLVFSLLLTFVFNLFYYGQGPNWNDGEEEIPPTPPHGDGTRRYNVPIDMYEGILLLIAIALIIGFYYYNKRRKLA